MFQLSHPFPSKCQYVSVWPRPSPLQSVSSVSILAQIPPKQTDVIVERALKTKLILVDIYKRYYDQNTFHF